MSVTVTFLGTGGSVPSKFRNLPSVLVRRGPELLLLDCGEGTQQQFIQARAGTNRKMRVLISHLHGDHVFGLPGLLHSLSSMGRTRELEILGPKGIAEFIHSVNRVVRLHSQFPITVREVRAGRVVDEAEYIVRAANANHGIPCLAYAFEEKLRPGKFDPKKAAALEIPEGPLWRRLQTGKSIRVGRKVISSKLVVGPPRRGVKITYAVDTRPCTSVIKLAARSDLLIHDSTFDLSSHSKARAYGHSTSVEAAVVAKKSKVRQLALFHISAMYDDPTLLVRQARKHFPRTVLSEDMVSLDVRV